MSDRAKIGAGLLAIVAAVLLFVVLQDDDDADQTSAKSQTGGKQQGKGPANDGTKPKPVPVIRIQGGAPAGGVQEVEVTSGERVRFRVVSDAEGEVHVHGYDDEKEVTAGGSVSFDFPATLEGGYEIELHGADGAHFQIGELKVQPG